MRRPSRFATVLITLTALLAGLVTAAPAGAAAVKYRLDPAHNIAPPNAAYGTACREHPQGTACEDIMITALNHARSVMDEPAYRLPASFHALAGREQLLVLSNLDRALYGRTAIRGLNPKLNANAAIGVRNRADPNPVNVVNHQHWTGFSANWAGGSAPMNSPMFAYFLWMYDDGVGSPNLDCQSAGDSGCWGHRNDTLLQTFSGDQIEMGVDGGTDRQGLYGWTELYEAFPGSGTIPCLPSVIGLSRHAVRTAGRDITVQGYGFVHVTKVLVLGQRATILARHRTSLTVRVPAHRAERGYLLVYTPAGRSLLTRAAGLRYVS